MAGKQKYYVVWSGTEPGIYTTWAECKARTIGVKASRYKSFPTLEAAEAAFRQGPPEKTTQSSRTDAAGKKHTAAGSLLENPPEHRRDTVLNLPAGVTADAWAVDAACSGNPGRMEYRGVDLATGAVVFHFGPLRGTNNIGEFLAIVHALALQEKLGQHKTIYSDSRNALLWIKARKCRTTLKKTAKTEAVHNMIERAERWLQTHEITNQIKKWQTSKWGEIPADFGRK
jgi:ribonuclease HI